MAYRIHASLIVSFVAATFLLSALAHAADTCKHRGDLDALYCDEDRNMTADAPTNLKKLKNPAALMLSYSPQEDAVVYEKLWTPYVDHLKSCSGKPVRFLPVYSKQVLASFKELNLPHEIVNLPFERLDRDLGVNESGWAHDQFGDMAL